MEWKIIGNLGVSQIQNSGGRGGGEVHDWEPWFGGISNSGVGDPKNSEFEGVRQNLFSPKILKENSYGENNLIK